MIKGNRNDKDGKSLLIKDGWEDTPPRGPPGNRTL
jgi:hypothetical protein